MKYTLFLSCINGFENNCISDIKNINIEKYVKYDGGVEFSGNLENIYELNQTSRYGMHLYWEIYKLPFNEKTLYNDIYNINWNKYFNNIHSFSIRVKSKNRRLNSQYITLLIKDGIVDYFNKKYGKRPNVNKKSPDIPIYVYIESNEIKIYINTTGEPLYKRGYRTKNVHTAPLNEVLAANIVSDLQSKELYDPMCGSGTLLIESAMKKLNIPSQICRKKFAFMNWFNYDLQLYINIKERLKNNVISDDTLLFYASDNDESSVNMIAGSTDRLNLDKNFIIRERNFFDFLPHPNSTIIFNPPYDIRISVNKKLENYYEKIGAILKNRCKNSPIYIFTIQNEYLQFLDMPCINSKNIKNGNLNCVLNTYHV